MKKSEKRLLRKFANILAPVHRIQTKLPVSNKKKFCSPITKSPKRYSNIRRERGRYTPRLIKSNIPYKEIHAEAIAPNIEFDEWRTWRDGMVYDKDGKRIMNPYRMFTAFPEEITRNNKKLRLLIKRRRAAKLKKRL